MKTVEIVFEDEWLIVVDKPSGLVVNRSQTAKGGTLQDEMFEYLNLTLAKGSNPNIGDRAGIVHRLDRETSGLLLVAKTQKAFEKLQEQFKSREVVKEYIGLVHGYLSQKEGIIDAKIARIGKFGKFGVVDRRSFGRESTTEYRLENYWRMEKDCFNVLIHQDKNLSKGRQRYLENNATRYSLLSVFPKTGRTHQVRVHLKSIGHPIVSDLIYGPTKLLKFDFTWCPRLFLHAKSLAFIHPKTKKRLKFESNLPVDLQITLGNLTLPSLSQEERGN